MIEFPTWRELFYKLAEEYPDCLMLNFTIKVHEYRKEWEEHGGSVVVCSGFQVVLLFHTIPTFLPSSYFFSYFSLKSSNYSYFSYPPQTLFVVGILFSRCSCVRVCVRACVRVCVRASVRPSVTFCFLNILKSHCWIFIKPCKHVHICKTNTLDKKVRARGQFY